MPEGVSDRRAIGSRIWQATVAFELLALIVVVSLHVLFPAVWNLDSGNRFTRLVVAAVLVAVVGGASVLLLQSRRRLRESQDDLTRAFEEGRTRDRGPERTELGE